MKKNKKLSNFGLADRISVFNSIFDDFIYCHPITQKNKKLKKTIKVKPGVNMAANNLKFIEGQYIFILNVVLLYFKKYTR